MGHKPFDTRIVPDNDGSNLMHVEQYHPCSCFRSQNGYRWLNVASTASERHALRLALFFQGRHVDYVEIDPKLPVCSFCHNSGRDDKGDVCVWCGEDIDCIQLQLDVAELSKKLKPQEV